MTTSSVFKNGMDPSPHRIPATNRVTEPDNCIKTIFYANVPMNRSLIHKKTTKTVLFKLELIDPVIGRRTIH